MQRNKHPEGTENCIFPVTTEPDHVETIVSSPFTLVRMLNGRFSSGTLSPTETALYDQMRKTEIRKTVGRYHRNTIAYDGRK